MTNASPLDLTHLVTTLSDPEATPLSAATIKTLLNDHALADLIEASHQLTHRAAPTTFNTCAIINAKADGCSCDCAWCAQSRHWNAKPAETSLVEESVALAGAKRTLSYGIGRYSLVTAGRKLSARTTREACNLLDETAKTAGHISHICLTVFYRLLFSFLVDVR